MGTVTHDAETVGSAGATPTPRHHGRFEPGQRLGTRYRIVGLLGSGGMGEVYRADDLELGQSVALKFLPERVAVNVVELERFRKEVRIAREIAHPNVCRMYDIAQAGGHTFLVMEYIDGEDLASVLRRMGRPSGDKALEIARQLCLGLAAAHEKGVLHRDLKPANVMIDGRGRVRITDFGLAGPVVELTRERSVGGTPGYMAPEQIGQGRVSIQSDIYSLGLILYETFTGQRAFDTRDPAELRRLHSESAVTTPSSLVADIDPAVERVILRCLDSDPSGRPTSAYQILAALPGGDPLAAALDAGETPSPELVANAGGTGGLRPAVAIGCLLFVVAGFVIHMFAERKQFESFDEPPRKLELKAEQVLALAGTPGPPRYSASGFLPNRQLEERRRDADSLIVEGPSPERPPEVFFWRRWSPRPMVHSNVHSPAPQLTDPPQSFAGSATVILDAQGRLVALHVVPVDTLGDAGPPDWTDLLGAAGFDPSELVPVAPSPSVLVGRADTIAAWKGRDIGGSDAEVTLLAGAYRGRPVHFSMGWDWGSTLTLETLEGPTSAPGGATGWAITLLMVVVPLGASVLIALHNLRMGRGDRRGASVLASFILFIYLAEALFQINIGEVGLQRVLIAMAAGQPMGHALIHAVQMWFAYVAIEPYVRRLWPRVLVSWARLVAGRWRDPIVGRDLLVGGVFAAAMMILFRLLGLLVAAGPRGLSVAGWLDAVSGMRDTLTTTSGTAAMSVLSGMLFFTTLLILRIALRRSLPAIIGACLFYGGALGVITAPVLGPAVSIPNGLIWGAGVGVIGLRFGFLAVLSGLFIRLMAVFVPWTLDLSSWAAEHTLVGVVTVGGLLLFGFVTSLGGQSLFVDLVPEVGGRPARPEPRS